MGSATTGFILKGFKLFETPLALLQKLLHVCEYENKPLKFDLVCSTKIWFEYNRLYAMMQLHEDIWFVFNCRVQSHSYNHF